MTCLEWVILILVIGFVTMFWACVVSICLGKVFEKKMEMHVRLEWEIFEKEMERLDKSFDKLFKSIMDLIKDTNTTK